MELKLGVPMNHLLSVRLAEDPVSPAGVKKITLVNLLFSGLTFNISLLVLSVRINLFPYMEFTCTSQKKILAILHSFAV